jgi:AmiR/NasT family two-component response regulator
MANDSPSQLRILIADGREERVDRVASVVAGLGHDVIARDTTLSDVGVHTAAERPDVALVILGESSQQALDQIGVIVKEAACPCIVILDVSDPEFVNEAAKLGIFAHVTTGGAATDLQSSIDIVLRRFAEYHNLEGAFARRAITERAKGVLMERHGVDEGAAFQMLRDHSRRTNRKIVDVADAIITSLTLLPSSPAAQDSDEEPFGPVGL